MCVYIANQLNAGVQGIVIKIIFISAVISSANDIGFRDDFNVTIESSPNETVCVEGLVNLTCWTNQPVKEVTWHWSDQSKEGSRITVRATPNEVVYICEATSDNGETREANITVVANGEYSITCTCRNPNI